jgi:hypothetical protein
LAVSLLPVAFSKRFDEKIPIELAAITVIMVFSALFLVEIEDLYDTVWWWDKVIHTGSGLIQGIVGFLLIYVLNESKSVEAYMKPGFVAFFAFCFSMTVAAIWEIFEFTMDASFGLNMQKIGLVDTMWDLIVGAFGALVISLLGYLYLRTFSEDSFLQRWIKSFIAENPRLFHDSGP